MSKHSDNRIQDNSFAYQLLRRYTDVSIHRAYRKLEYIGLEKIPKDGAIIFAPNHTNTLMDALVVLSYNESQPIVFVARADIFKKPALAKIFAFLKIMPIMRMRDGIAEVKKNDETMERAVKVLMDKVPFCILPEGRHRTQHSLLPLNKGIFRIAIQAQERLEDNMPLYIVPFGIEYGNFFRFRSTALCQIGEPINIKEYLSLCSDKTQPEVMNMLKDELTQRIKDVILYIPDDEWYNATYELCAIASNQQARHILKNSPELKKRDKMTSYKANIKTVQEVQNIRNNKPEIASKLLTLAQEVYEIRTKESISLRSIIVQNPLWNSLIKVVIFITTLPYTICASILASPISIVSRLVFKNMKDIAFFNSVRFLVSLLLWPILIFIYTIVFFCTLPWQWAVFAVAATLPATTFAQEAYKLLRTMVSDAMLIFNKPLRKKVKQLRQYFFEHNK